MRNKDAFEAVVAVIIVVGMIIIAGQANQPANLPAKEATHYSDNNEMTLD